MTYPRRHLSLTVSAMAMLALTSSVAADWPQFLGPTRNGVYSGPAIADAWPASGPRQVWKKDVGPGFSGPVVADGKVILFHRVGAQEVIEALQPATGATIWQFGYPTTYRDDFGFDEGPRAVPVVASGVVYTFGAEGQLHAVDVATGKKLWSDDTAARFGVAKNFFGAGGSPLVEDGRVIANVGGKDAGIVAFEARTGRLLWKATTDGASYSSGVGATIGSERVAIFFTRNGIVVLDPATAEATLRAAAEVERTEARIKAVLDAGGGLSACLNLEEHAAALAAGQPSTMRITV